MVLEDNQKITTDFHQANYTIKGDYTNPINERFSIETGSAYTLNDIANDYTVNNWENNNWIFDPNLSNNFSLNQKVFGGYATIAYELENLGIKGGIRIENTDLRTYLINNQTENTQNYTDWFPSMHTSYKFSNLFSIQAGYSRRIFRPRLWDLNPFFNIKDNYYIRVGNPDLLPQYADSYELTSIFSFKQFSFNTSIYHLYTSNVIEWVSTLKDGIIYYSPLNIGTNAKTGVSIDGKYSPFKWININGDFNYGTYIRQGIYNDENFDKRGEQWETKLTTKFKLKYDIEFEIKGHYQSAFKTVQGDFSGTAFADVGLRKKFFKGKLIFDISVRDILDSRKRESYVYESNYEAYSLHHRGRHIKIGLSYGFGKGEAMTYQGGRRHF
jgi:outer membrane receptor protein involved in Fe transport